LEALRSASKESNRLHNEDVRRQLANNKLIMKSHNDLLQQQRQSARVLANQLAGTRFSGTSEALLKKQQALADHRQSTRALRLQNAMGMARLHGNVRSLRKERMTEYDNWAKSKGVNDSHITQLRQLHRTNELLHKDQYLTATRQMWQSRKDLAAAHTAARAEHQAQMAQAPANRNMSAYNNLVFRRNSAQSVYDAHKESVRNMKAGYLEQQNKYQKQIESRLQGPKGAGQQGFVFSKQAQLQQAMNKAQDTSAAHAQGNLALRRQDLRLQNDVLKQMRLTHGAESEHYKLAKKLHETKEKILRTEQRRADALAKLKDPGTLRTGMSRNDQLKRRAILSDIGAAQATRTGLLGQYSKVRLGQDNLAAMRARLVNMENAALNENALREKFGRVVGVMTQMATTALITGFMVAFASDRLRDAIIKPAIAAFTELETELSRFRSIAGIDRNTEEGRKRYNENINLIRQESMRSGYDKRATTRALSDLISAGIDPNIATKMLPHVLSVTQASYGEITPEQAGKVMATIFQKFDLSKLGSFEEQSQYMADWVFQLKQASKLEFKEVPGFLDSLQASPSILKMSTQEVGALGTSLMRKGQGPRNAAQQINALSPNIFKIIRAIDPEVPNGGFGKLIVEQNALGYGLTEKDFYNDKKEFVGGWQFMKNMYDGYQRSKKLVGEGRAQAGMYNMFQTARGQNVLASIDALQIKTEKGTITGWEALEQLRGELSPENKNLKGISERTAEQFRKTPEGAAIAWNSMITNLRAAIGDRIWELTSVWILRLVEALEQFTDWVDKHKDVADFIAKTTLALFGLTSALGTFLIVGGMTLFLAGEIVAIIGGLGLAGTVAMLAIAGLVSMLGLIAGLVITSFGSTDIMETFANAIEKIKMVFAGLAEMWNDYSTPEELFVRMYKAGVWPLVRGILMLKYRFEQLWDGILEGTASARDFVRESFKGLADAIGEGMGVDKLIFSNPDYWKEVGKAIGTIFAALYIGAGLFLIFLTLIVRAFGWISKSIMENKLAWTVMGIVAGFTLMTIVMGLLTIMGLMALLGLVMASPFIAMGLWLVLVVKFWQTLIDEIVECYNWLVKLAGKVMEIGGLTGMALVHDIAVAFSDNPREEALGFDGMMDMARQRILGKPMYEGEHSLHPRSQAELEDIARANTVRAAQGIVQETNYTPGNIQSNAVHIGKIEVVAPEGADPDAWGKQLSKAIERHTLREIK
jgi:hypothetical protein